MEGRHLPTMIARLSLAAALLLAAAWALAGFQLEAWITLFVLVAALAGLLVDPWLRQRERRRGILRDLAREFAGNVQALRDPSFSSEDEAFHIYPRLGVAVTEAAMSSGQFSGGSDAELLTLLHGWSNRARAFNNRLDLTEFLTATDPSIRAAFQRRLCRGDMLDGVRRHLITLGHHLLNHYEAESGIGVESQLFAEIVAPDD